MMYQSSAPERGEHRGDLRVVALGCSLRPLERISVAGRLIGVGSRSTAYRLAESDRWPLVGPESSRWVLMLPLLEKYGIPYEVRETADLARNELTFTSSGDAGNR